MAENPRMKYLMLAFVQHPSKLLVRKRKKRIKMSISVSPPIFFPEKEVFFYLSRKMETFCSGHVAK